MISAFGIEHGEVSKAFVPANTARAGKAFNIAQNAFVKPGMTAAKRTNVIGRAQKVAASAGRSKYTKLP